MLAAQITEKVLDVADRFGSRNPQQLKQLKFVFSKRDPEEVFEGLFSVLCMDCKNKFERHQLAGELLYSVRPRLHLELLDRIHLTLASWNVSVEEWPWYLVDLCGLDRVLSAASDLEAYPLSEDERRRLNTLVWWAKRYRVRPDGG